MKLIYPAFGLQLVRMLDVTFHNLLTGGRALVNYSLTVVLCTLLTSSSTGRHTSVSPQLT